MGHLKTFILALLILSIVDKAKADVILHSDTLLNGLIKQNNANQVNAPMDKLYLQLDRATYASGDTLWFRAYLFDATFFRKSARSNVVYVELSDENNVVQVRRQLLMSNGLGHGCIPLTKRDFPDGGYTIRAYTQWMRNFDESGIFKKQFYVGPPDANKWLVKMSTGIKDNTAQLHLQLLDNNKKPLANQQVLLAVRQDESILRRDKPQVTDDNGGIDLAVHIRDSQSPVYATFHKGSYDDAGNTIYKFPVNYNRPEKTDLQLMPEGGYLVSGIPSVVGFKAIAEDGKGTDINGIIINTATGKQVTAFASLHKGMGSFSFIPQAGVSYKAIASLAGGIKKEYSLPQVKATGTALSANNLLQGDSITITVNVTPDVSGRYHLVGQSRGMVCFGASITLQRGAAAQTFCVPKTAFASGIVKFTLLDEQHNALNERLIYNDNKDNLQINVNAARPTYFPQDSIALQVEVRDKQGNPIQGAFSMSVTNSAADIPNPDNPTIVSHLLLTSDVKGYVEQPDYYFAGSHEKELDNLMLTQGWTAYDWKPQPSKPIMFTAEPDISVSGKSTDMLNKPIGGNNLQLISLNPFFSIDTVSDKNGSFMFRHIPLSDSLMYIRAKNKKGKVASYNIELNKREWPAFSANRLQTPWYFNTDTLRLKVNDTLLRNNEIQLPSTTKMLKEVIIRDKRVIAGSHNLNGPGEADQVIDEHDIAKENPMTLLELLKKKVEGFRTENTDIKTRYFVDGEELYSQNIYIHHKGGLILKIVGGFIIDGIEVRKFFKDPADIYHLLNSYTSANIKGIEVMSKVYNSNYDLNFVPYYFPPPGIIVFPPVFIEITTKDGTGPFFKKQADYLLFKPIASVIRKDFYKPKYAVKNPAAAAFDNRTTIHWEPNIITDKNGKATVSFYAGGQPANYTITTEGSNMDGNVGNAVTKITIKANTP